jgi:putative peptidoglycan lipid II flippase
MDAATHTTPPSPPPPPPAPPSSTAGEGCDEAREAAPLSAAVRIVSGLTLLSRFAGLARDVLTARMFGAGLLGSAFQAAYTFPNFFRRLFGEGALSAAFLPQYTLLKRDDPALAGQLASITLWALTLATGSLTLLIEAVLLILLLAAPADSDRALSFRLMMLMLPMMPAVCITAILGGMLQAHGRFGPPAAATIVQILWSLHALRGMVRWTRIWHDARAHARTVLSRFIPAVLGLGTLQLNSFLDMLFAMWPVWVGPTLLGFTLSLDEQSNALLRYSQTLYQFPLGVFGIAVATAVFPLLSRAGDDPPAFLQHLRRGLRLSLYIGLPASVGLFLVRAEVLRLIYGGGEHGFDEASIARAAAVLAGFAPAIWAYSLNHVLTRAFYAKGDTVTPMKLAVGAVVLNFALNCTLIWPLREAGLAWSTAISATLQCAILMLLCGRVLNVRPLDGATCVGLGRTILASALMGAVVFFTARAWTPTTDWTDNALRLAALLVAGAGSYALFSAAMRLPELKWLLHPAPRGPGGAALPLE